MKSDFILKREKGIYEISYTTLEDKGMGIIGFECTCNFLSAS